MALHSTRRRRFCYILYINCAARVSASVRLPPSQRQTGIRFPEVDVGFSGADTVNMKSLIKRADTMESFTETGSWTEDLSQAKVFPNVTTVHETKKNYDLKNVEHYVLQREEISSLDFSIPIG
jgi:hypothetical protein